MSSESDGGSDQVESAGLFKGIQDVGYRSGTMPLSYFKKRDSFIWSFALHDHTHREGFFIRPTLKLMRRTVEKAVCEGFSRHIID